jgi:hypothetical protein
VGKDQPSDGGNGVPALDGAWSDESDAVPAQSSSTRVTGRRYPPRSSDGVAVAGHALGQGVDRDDRVALHRRARTQRSSCHDKRLSHVSRDIMTVDSVTMIRTQISLSKPEYLAAKKAAKALGISLAELLRRGLRTMIPQVGSKPWMKMAGMVNTGDPMSSQKIDEIVYGFKK